ncbi:hypothetical protein CP533_5762, partial [Ophiocordyceps camponoti-saundersi (nom. inval.)]
SPLKRVIKALDLPYKYNISQLHAWGYTVYVTKPKEKILPALRRVISSALKVCIAISLRYGFLNKRPLFGHEIYALLIVPGPLLLKKTY